MNTKNNHTIREATANDLVEIQMIFRKSIQKSCSSDYSQEQINAWMASIRDLAKWMMKIQNDHFILCEEESCIQGFASLKKPVYIDMMYVHPDHQSKGLATQLLEEIILEARNDHQLLLSTHASLSARPFFEAKGFEVVRQNDVIRKNIKLINFEMKLNLRN